MRLALSALALLSCPLALLPCQSNAAEPPLRFSIAESWTMPLVQLEQRQPTEGILYDMMQSLAQQVGRRAEYQLFPRLRVGLAMERGEVDIRCYAAQAWQPGLSGDYVWSLPMIMQRDVLVARAGDSGPVAPGQLRDQAIGTVLGYVYRPLEQQFSRGQLRRDDARSQDQVLEKLVAGRYRYAVTNQLSLDWFNRHLPAGQKLHEVALLEEQGLGCYVRNDPALPVQRILRTLLRMKMSGEMDRLIEKYNGQIN